MILILYTRTSVCVGEYSAPNFSCTESTSYPEKKKRLELNLWISVKNIWVLFFFLVGGAPCTLQLFYEITYDQVLKTLCPLGWSSGTRRQHLGKKVMNILLLFCFVGFYGISTIVGYLMPNALYTYILNIYDLWTYFVDNILKRACALFYTQLNGFKYCYITVTIQHPSFICTHSLFYLIHR